MKLRMTGSLAALCVSTQFAAAVQVEWEVGAGGNGNLYEAVYVPNGISWTDARDAAIAAGGHLVTLTSMEENEFVFGLIDSDQFWNNIGNVFNDGPWIGAFQPTGSAPYEWVTGEAFAYTNWGAGQPDGNGPATHYWNGGNGVDPITRSSSWDDVPGTAFTKGYIIEYEVPDHGATLGLLGAAMLALGGIRRTLCGGRGRSS